jgi:hypothetical protein
MGRKILAGALLMAVLTFGVPTDARAGCVTNYSLCNEWAWSLDSWWDWLWAADLCQRAYMECMKEKLLGL